jgi:succinyl-diaminopimelate desuccinylase
MKRHIFAFLEAQKQWLVEVQRQLVALPALGPESGGQGEKEKAECLTSFLKECGLTNIKELQVSDERVACGYRPNICALIPGKDQSQTIWIVSHLDVVPPGDSQLWNTDPYILFQDNDLIYGRGVEDNHHGLTASLLTAKYFLSHKITPQVNLGLLFVADEETGNKYGLEYLLNHHESLFAHNDFFLVPDFGNAQSDMVEVAEKGLMWLKFTLHGQQCHASTPERGANTLVAASDLIVRLRRLYDLFSAKDSMFDPEYSTFEATKKEANVPNVNTIPGKDVFYLDCRVLPEYTLDEVMEEIQKMTQETSHEYKTEIFIETLHKESAPSTDPTHPLVRRFMDCIREVLQRDARPQGIGGGTVAAYLRNKGYPAVVWSTLLGNAHQPNEHTSLTNILYDAHVMATFLCEPF